MCQATKVIPSMNLYEFPNPLDVGTYLRDYHYRSWHKICFIKGKDRETIKYPKQWWEESVRWLPWLNMLLRWWHISFDSAYFVHWQECPWIWIRKYHTGLRSSPDELARSRWLAVLKAISEILVISPDRLFRNLVEKCICININDNWIFSVYKIDLKLSET